MGFIQVRDGRSSAADVCKLRDRMLLKRCKTGEDVAPASEAWDHCRVHLSQPNPLVSFQVDLKGGKKLPFQTTVGAAGGSILDAERIARLCWEKLRKGTSKEAVLEYRSKLYKEVDAEQSGTKSGAKRVLASASGPPKKRQRS